MKSSATSIAAIAGLSGITTATSSKNRSFKEVIVDWIDEHGQIVDFDIEDKEPPQTRVLTYEFEDGHVEEVFETFRNNHLIHKVNGKTYKQSYKELQRQAEKINKKRSPEKPTKTTQGSPAETQSSLTTQSVPTVNPGNDKSWIYANGGMTMTDEELAIDDAFATYSEANFKAEASSTAIAAGAAAAESIVYREWQVGYQSDEATPVMKVTVDYDISGHLSGVAASAKLIGRLWLEDTLTGDYVEEYIINKTAMPADNYNNRETGTKTFYMEARPGRTYRMHAQGYTSVVAVWTSGGQSFFNDTMLMNNWVEIDNIDLEWV